MTVIHFPDEQEFAFIESFSVVDNLICNRKPFGDVTAEQYFEFAKSAKIRGDKAGMVDALSNAKRCFHYQVDRLLYRYGLLKATSNLSFPAKVQLLSELNIIPGTLLRIYNTERNAMEHEYTFPNSDTVDGSIDLCDLLFLATDRFLRNSPARLRVKFRNDNRDVVILLEPGTDRLQFFQVLGSELRESSNGKCYPDRLYNLEGNLDEGVTINRISNEDIELALTNKEKWISYLKLFSSISKNDRDFPSLPDEPMATILHYIPWQVMNEVFDESRKERNKKEITSPKVDN